MGRFQYWTWGVCAAALGLMAAGGAEAGSGSGGSGGSGSGGSGSSSGCGCVSTTHQVKVPGVEITAPTVTVNLPALNVVTASGASTASSSSSSGVNVSVGTQTSSGVNTQAIINSAALGGGGGGSWSDSGSVTTTIDTVRVETPEQPQTRRICAAFKAVQQTIAVQASCLDDKAVPHPASQVSPERAVDLGYDGEIYRCIAGARMQYVIADFSGQVDFDHGQTFTCQKGEALYHAAGGALQCRPQKPARDCNERSLLRRYGAGIKVLQTVRKDVCTEWRTETVQASASY
jgi:hypothetical protein